MFRSSCADDCSYNSPSTNSPSPGGGNLAGMRSRAAPSVARGQPCGCRSHSPIQREIAIRGIAGSKRANRRNLRQGAGLTAPPKPSHPRAKGHSKHAVSVKNFDAGAGLWINVVQWFVGCAPFGSEITARATDASCYGRNCTNCAMISAAAVSWWPHAAISAGSVRAKWRK